MRRYKKYRIMKKSTITFLLLILASSLNAINVVFRCDDPCISYDSVNSRIIELFIRKQVPLSIAMIPCNSNEEPYQITDSLYWQNLNSSNIEVCLHGLTHQDINKHGEFGLLSSKETQRRINKGKTILQSFFTYPIQTFIPPFNAINDSLPKILKEEGFCILASDRFDNIFSDDVLYYPETLGHLMKQMGIWKAAEKSIFDNVTSSDLCIIMFHAYDLPNEESWQVLENLLDACKQNIDIHLYTFSGLKQAKIDGSKARYKANNLEGLLKKHFLPTGVLCSTFHCYGLHILNALLYLILALIFTFISRRIMPTPKGKLLCLLFGLMGAFVICVFALLHTMGPLKLWLLDIILCAVIFLISIITHIRH